MLSVTRKFLTLFLLTLVSAFAQYYGGGGNPTTIAGNVTYSAAGAGARASNVQTVLRSVKYANQYLTVQDAINAATGGTLIFTEGVYNCAGVTWGTTSNMEVIIYHGANLTACTLPAANVDHFILDLRNGLVNANQVNGAIVPLSAYLLGSDANGRFSAFTFPASKYLLATDSSGHVIEKTFPTSQYLLSTDSNGQIVGKVFGSSLYLLATDSNGQIVATSFPASKTIVGTDSAGKIIQSTHLADFDHTKIATAEQAANKGAANGYAGLNASTRFQTTTPVAGAEVATKDYVDNQVLAAGTGTTVPAFVAFTQGTTTNGASVTLLNYTGAGGLISATCKFYNNPGSDTVESHLLRITLDGQTPVDITVNADYTGATIAIDNLVGYIGDTWLPFLNSTAQSGYYYASVNLLNTSFKTSAVVALVNTSSNSGGSNLKPSCKLAYNKKVAN